MIDFILEKRIRGREICIFSFLNYEIFVQKWKAYNTFVEGKEKEKCIRKWS